jgi:2-keto-3-deoxy-L-rhamnonate aldolase RhmA
MALKLMYITNDERIAKIAEDSGVDWVFIDLEINGKEQRQGHLDTVISRHSIRDVSKIKKVLSKSQLLVRVNPIFEGSRDEIDRVINDGADIVMLPFFNAREEVEEFMDHVDGRVQTCLLLETPQAVSNVDLILTAPGADYVHIGLNDLHLGYGMKFMFELLADGTVESLCNRIKAKGITYGFGGIAQLGQGTLPAEYVIAEHYRLGSSMAILSRSFCNANKLRDIDEIAHLFRNGVAKIRDYERYLEEQSAEFFAENVELVRHQVAIIVESIAG